VLSWIAKRFDKAVDVIEKQHAIDDVLRELGEYLTDHNERIDRILLLILDKLPDNNMSARTRQETSELKRDTIKSRIRSLQVQLKKHQANLNWLEEQSAKYGPNVTLEITNGIIYEREKISELEQEIDYLKKEIDG